MSRELIEAERKGEGEGTEHATKPVIRLSVGDVRFLLEETDIDRMGSEFLNSLTDPDSPFERPQVYAVQADPEAFSSFLHLARFGKLPVRPGLDRSMRDQLLEHADFWGIADRVSAALDAHKDDRMNMVRHVSIVKNHRVTLHLNRFADARVHHNHRRDDGHGRIYCNICGNRDFDKRWYRSDDAKQPYTKCKHCNKVVFYAPALDWCHKCNRCKKCQPTICPSDDHSPRDNYGDERTATEELESQAMRTIQIHALVAGSQIYFFVKLA
jgi:phage FluMu protein Com